MAFIRPDGTITYDQITRAVEVQANYLASKKDGFGIDDSISIYTGLMPWNWFTPGVSHTSVGYWFDGELWFFSSTSRKELGGKNGTRWIRGTKLLRNPERWLLQESHLNMMFYGRTIMGSVRRANSLIGLGYDFYGVGVDFINPLRVFFKKDLTYKTLLKIKRIYCSKAVHAVQTGIIAVFSPRRKYKWAERNGYKLIENTWNYLNRLND